MSTGRMKDQKDYDLEQIVSIIDTALESDDRRIKDALRALMTITVLCTAEHPDQAIKGPLARIIEDMHNLAKRLSTLEDEMRKLQWNQQKRQVEPFTPPYNPGSPWTSPNDPTKPKPMWGPNLSSGDDPDYTGARAFTQADLDMLAGKAR